MALKIDGDEVKSIKALVVSLNGVFKIIDEKLDGLVDSIKTLSDEQILGAVKGAKDTADAALAIATENKKAIHQVNDKIEYFSELVEEENLKLKQKLNHLENYSRRDNLVIRGIAETKDEVCETIVKNFCKDKMKLDSVFIDSIKIVRCHRLGERQHGKPKWIRPIIVRFYNFGDRQQVWGARSKLAGTPYGVTENFTGETEYNRKRLYPIFKAAKKMQKYEKKVYMYEDTLILNNIRYTVKDLDNLPEDVHPKKFCSKRNDTTEVFGGILSEHSTLSNWSPSQIQYKNNVYVNLEQAYMHIKALENGDNAAAQKIQYTKDPREIKRVGSKLAVYDNEKWNTIRHGVMHDLVKAKFMQNDDMARELIQTGNRKLGETGKGSDYAIGVTFTHPNVLDPTVWTSASELGKTLEAVRDELQA